jgi:hypothetical protein
MAISKLSKRFFYLLVLISFIVAIMYYQQNTSKDSGKSIACDESKFITRGERTFLDLKELNIDIKSNNFSIIAKNENKQIKYYKIYSEASSKNEIIYFDEKILKTDTLLIKCNNKEIRIYDFRNKGWLLKHGKDRGKFHCYRYMKINSVEYCLESDTIYINKTDLKNF